MLKDFGDIAKKLSNNPLGIIALFIVLVYGIAGLVLSTSSQAFAPAERLPLVWFLVLFPPVVLFTFSWLVARHHPKLYAPSDYPDPSVFLRTMDPEAQRQKLDREVAEIEDVTPLQPASTKTIAAPSVNRAALHTRLLLAEDLVMRELSAEFGASIQRQVGFDAIGLDGVFVRDGQAFGIEVKYLRHTNHVSNAVESLLRIDAQVHRLGWKRFNLIFAAVIDDPEPDSLERFQAAITKALERFDLKPQTRIYRISALLKKYGATLPTG